MNILKYKKINICCCDMCKNNDSEKNILQRILNCNCKNCKFSKDISFIYLTCIQLHFLYTISHDLDIVNNTIQIIHSEYKRKKKMFILYSKIIGKLLKIYNKIK
jgi:hypothetical protein